MDFLHYLDIAIGFAMAMVILSTLVATASQAWITAIRTRTRQLEHGLGAVLLNLGLENPEELLAKILSNRNLKISDWGMSGDPAKTGPMQWLMQRLRSFSAETIDREELILVLLRMAAKGDAHAVTATGLASADVAKQKLGAVEEALAREEANDPGAPAHSWRTRALAAQVPALAGKVFSHFDNVMDRVEDNVNWSSKWTSAVCALVFLALYPVNSFELLQRVSTNDALRAGLVEKAKTIDLDKPDAVKDWVQKSQPAGLFGTVIEQPWWRGQGVTDIARNAPGHFLTPGVFLTWVFVSLGSPFWLGMVSRLVGLRSEMAKKASDQRDLREREFTTARPATAGKAAGV